MPQRNIQLKFRVTPEEEATIRHRMQQLGIQSIGAFLRKMAISGYCIRVEMQEVKEMLRLLRITSNNINQYTRKANETGQVYEEDVRHIQESQEELWQVMKQILLQLAQIQ